MEYPRERLMKYGSSVLSDYELLAIILRTGGNGRDVLEFSKELLLRTGGWTGLQKSGINELLNIKGMGMAKAMTVKAVIEISKRLMKVDTDRYKITGPETAFSLLKPYFWGEEKEKLLLITLNNRNYVIDIKIVNTGGSKGVVVTPKDIFVHVIREGGEKIIISHNHPSGDLDPSNEDIVFTKKIRKAGDIVGIELLDHLIINNNKFISLKTENYF